MLGNLQSALPDGSRIDYLIDGQRTELTLNAEGYLASVTNPANETYRLDYYAGGLLKNVTDPKGHGDHFVYDAAGRLVRNTNAGHGGWTIARTEEDRGYTASMTSAEGRTSRFQVEPLAIGDRRQVNTAPNGTIETKLFKTNGEETKRTQSLSAPAGLTLTYSYDGGLVTSETLAGPVTGTLTRSYDTDFRVKTLSVNGASITLGYDNDSLLTSAGSLGLTRDPDNGLLTGTALALSGGSQIDYLIDGRNRRVGKKPNGALVQGFLYQDQLRPIAELDGNNQVVTRFVYADKPNVPTYLIKNGVTYRIISDHLGSPRLIVNTEAGSIVQRMDYDEWGRVMLDRTPASSPSASPAGSTIATPDSSASLPGTMTPRPGAGRRRIRSGLTVRTQTYTPMS